MPVGWAATSIGEATICRDGERVPVSQAEREGRDKVFDYYGASGVIDKIDGYLFDKPLLLVGEDGANLINRSTPIAFMARGRYWVNNHAHVLDGISEELLLFIELYFNAIDLKPYVTGTAQPKMNQSKMNGIAVALPPVAEQHRIVAKVDELMALCDRLEAQQADAASAHAQLVQALLGSLTQASDATEFAANWQRLAEHFHTLFSTEPSIDALKQALLQLAVMGKLVPQDPSEESANELLNRIQAEKQRLVAEGKLKKQKPPTEIAADEKFFELASGWQWARLLDCSMLITDGEHLTPQRTSDSSQVPLVTAKNVRDGFMDYGNTDYVERSIAEKCWGRCKPEVGDIMMVSVGATLGRLTVIREKMDMVIVRSVTLIRPLFVDADYLALMIRSPQLQSAIWAGVKQSAQPGLYLAQSSLLLMAVPPLAEQHRIVAKVNQLMALCDQLKTQLTQARQLNQQLASTLVEQAVA